MARKKTIDMMPATLSPFERKMADNHSPGVTDLPNYSTDPSNGRYTDTPAAPGYKINFPAMVAKGESANEGDVNVITANGISNSRNKGRGVQYNWGDGTDGVWGDNNDWDGGNVSGI